MPLSLRQLWYAFYVTVELDGSHSLNWILPRIGLRAGVPLLVHVYGEQNRRVKDFRIESNRLGLGLYVRRTIKERNRFPKISVMEYAHIVDTTNSSP